MPISDEVFMQRCIDLAWRGQGYVAPNPMVGCVIVHQGKIIGEGYHEKFGSSHAEVNAVNAVIESDRPLLTNAALFVTLEPCAHHGKTPPCADLIIEKKIPRVVIGCVDPNPLVAGKGIQKLRQAGISCEIGLLEKACKRLNRRFFTFFQEKRPYIILKWAQSSDGMLAPQSKMRINISNDFSRTLVHRWRSEESAILVGTGTALHDNPKLDTRLWNGRNPVRIVLDRSLQLPTSSHVFDHSIPTVVFTEKERAAEENLKFIKISAEANLLDEIIHKLYELHIQSVLVEGGSVLLQSFIDKNYWDEVRIFIAPKMLGRGVRAPVINGTVISEETFAGDRLLIFENAR